MDEVDTNILVVVPSGMRKTIDRIENTPAYKGVAVLAKILVESACIGSTCLMKIYFNYDYF
jgi:hypothetical protein